jgi:hypothetical protein
MKTVNLVVLRMGFSRRWSVESKDYELLVVGGETGVRVRESCKGRMRPIL